MIATLIFGAMFGAAACAIWYEQMHVSPWTYVILAFVYAAMGFAAILLGAP